ncbi:calcium-binding protein [Granulosicoccus sp. 3-233]|uniref:calcium-binding protein n=1 Tax=Granulosicoccus sp. 3-233 TaxID=3417969 RepID=UPI003D337E3A
MTVRWYVFALYGILSFWPLTSAAVTLNGGDGLISASISVIGEIDVYEIDLDAGDSLLLRVAETESTEFVSDPFYPRIELYDPSGAYLTGGEGYLVGTAHRRATVSGEYEIRIFDDSSGQDEIGTYDFYFAVAPGADEGGSLSDDGVITDRIDLGDVDSYVVDLDAGESFYAAVADLDSNEFVSSPFYPRIELYAPNGEYLTGSEGYEAARLYRRALVSGSYTLVVFDDSAGSDATGNYSLHFAKAPGTADGGFLQSVTETSGFMEKAELESFNIALNAGDSLYVRMAETDSNDLVSSPFYPRVELFGPDGAYLTGGEGYLVAGLYRRAQVAGNYTVIAYDDSSGSAETGNFDLYVAKIPDANEGNGISGGQSKTGFIDLGDLDTYAFEPVNAGVNIAVTVADLDEGPLYPRVELFGPDGAYITGTEGYLTASFTRTLNVLGRYTLIVYDDSSGYDATGNYQLSMVGNVVGVSGGNANLCNGLTVTVDLSMGQSPTPGNDVILGTPGNDVIRALGGDDTVCALQGNDEVYGANGQDWIDAGPGADFVTGGAHNDTIRGGSGNDRLVGNGGDDDIDGEAGDDVLFGSAGDDVLMGSAGNDRLNGDNGEDTLVGGDGNDILKGYAGNDMLYGGPGIDNMSGGSGDDFLSGGLSNDTMGGNTGVDILKGDQQNDKMYGGPGGPDECDGGVGGSDFAGPDCEIVAGVP